MVWQQTYQFPLLICTLYFIIIWYHEPCSWRPPMLPENSGLLQMENSQQYYSLPSYIFKINKLAIISFSGHT